MAKNTGFEGINEFIKILDDIPQQIKGRGEQSALYKAAKPIETKARNYIKSYARGTDKDGFSKMLLMAQNVRRVRYKGGINIQIKNIVDIPVKNLKDRSHFSAFGWAKLTAQGRQWTAKGSTSRKKYWTGRTQGRGDFIEQAYYAEGRKVLSDYRRLRIPMIQKAFNRSIKRYGIRS